MNLESLGNALHKKDYYGKEAISEPQVWSKTFSDPMQWFVYSRILIAFQNISCTGANHTQKRRNYFGSSANESSFKGKSTFLNLCLWEQVKVQDK